MTPDPTLDLVTTEAGVQLVDASSGEVLSLGFAPLDLLALFVEQARDRKREIDAMIRAVTDEVCERADRENATTLAGDRYSVTVDGPGLVAKYDGEALANRIGDLVAEGVLTEQAAFQIVHPETAWRIDTYALRRARKNPRVEEATDEAVLDRSARDRRITKIMRY